jgi:hypothetical protein
MPCTHVTWISNEGEAVNYRGSLTTLFGRVLFLGPRCLRYSAIMGTFHPSLCSHLLKLFNITVKSISTMCLRKSNYSSSLVQSL